MLLCFLEAIGTSLAIYHHNYREGEPTEGLYQTLPAFFVKKNVPTTKEKRMKRYQKPTIKVDSKVEVTCYAPNQAYQKPRVDKEFKVEVTCYAPQKQGK